MRVAANSDPDYHTFPTTSNTVHTSSHSMLNLEANENSLTLAQLWQSVSGWLVVGVLLLIQFSLFYQFAQREVVWAYPTNYDQTVDLMGSYITYEHVLSDGLLSGLSSGLLIPSPRGTMLYPQASILFLLLGPSRMTALTLNFAYFALFQCVLVWSLRWITSRWSIALLGLGLLLTVATPFFWAGGLMDFRIDFIAFCLFGILLCIVIRSRMFMSWRWSLIVGVVASLLILFRLLTIVYVSGVFGGFFVFICIRIWLRRRRTLVYQSLKQQIYGIFLAGGVISAISLPYLWYNRQNIEDYYIVGHVVSSEKEFRAQVVGVFNLVDSLLFYPKSLIFDHAGAFFIVSSALVITVSLLIFWKNKIYKHQELETFGLDVKSMYFFVVISIVVPYVILTIDVAKSLVVSNIMVAPLIWLVLITVMLLLKAYDAKGGYLNVYGPALMTTFVLCFGLYNQFDRLSDRGILSKNRADVEQVLQLHDAVFQYSREIGWEEPVLSIDKTTDYFSGDVLNPVIYERHGVLINMQEALGVRAVVPVTSAEAIALLEKSDFALITTSDKIKSSFPFDRSIQAIRPKLLAFCDQYFFPLEYSHFFDRDVVLYVRLKPRIEGQSGDWITSNGITMHHLGKVLQARPNIELRGKTNFSLLSKIPEIRAQLVQFDRNIKTIPVTIKITGNDYLIALHLDPKDIDGDRAAQIHLSFDTYFVPKDIGVSEDTRRLVIRAPQEIMLLP
jgi:hypothetical protein